jgi:hypothetical protein
LRDEERRGIPWGKDSIEGNGGGNEKGQLAIGTADMRVKKNGLADERQPDCVSRSGEAPEEARR